MNSKSMTYLQFKSTADKLATTNNNITAENLYNLLSEISTQAQIDEYYKRWLQEQAQKKTENINQSDQKLLRQQELERALSVTRGLATYLAY